MREAKKAGYKLFTPEKLLSILRECSSENAIFKDFREYLECVVNNDVESLGPVDKAQ